MVELLDHRTLHGKLFDHGAGSYGARLSTVPLHVPHDPARWARGDASALEDIDLSWDTDGQTWQLRRAWYGLTVTRGIVGYCFQDRTTGDTLSVQLVQLGDAPVRDAAPPRLCGTHLWWDDVQPGVDVYLDLRPTGVEIFKVIRTPSAPRSFVWRVQESVPARLGWFSTLTRGWDATGTPARLVFAHGPEVVTRGQRVRQVTETWTGQTIARDAVTHRAAVSSAVTYPVLIDFDVSVAIAADADDGFERVGTLAWSNSYGGQNLLQQGIFYPGFRFVGVGIPQGATITLATFTYYIASGGGSDGTTATLYGWAHDNAPAWADAAGPLDMTATSASVAFLPFGGSATGVHTLDVAAIVQEVVNRAGWASGHALAFGLQGTLAPVGAFSFLVDRAGGTSNIPTLDVNFTAGGGGGGGGFFGSPLMRLLTGQGTL